ncbi:unnamed protein product [Periconia digitata]|uniref:Uncharacterized protein n=1 Tax=Periconia digitata TaxID=1303443 RepID=A0A9W4UHU1_9PLEO|nr:unnamed protein product [Periconia digitata]
MCRFTSVCTCCLVSNTHLDCILNESGRLGGASSITTICHNSREIRRRLNIT